MICLRDINFFAIYLSRLCKVEIPSNKPVLLRCVCILLALESTRSICSVMSAQLVFEWASFIITSQLCLSCKIDVTKTSKSNICRMNYLRF